MGKPHISVSILSADFGNLREVVKELDDCGVDSIHLDIMDGNFVPQLTFGPAMVSALRSATDIPFEAHFMVEEPEKYVNDFVKAGADSIIVHSEAIADAKKAMTLIRSYGADAGIAIDLGTRFESVKANLRYANRLLIMSVKAGFGGQKFVPESLKEIEKARSYIDKNRLDVVLEVDGGINMDTGKVALSAGVDELVIGTAIVCSKDIKKSVKDFKSL